MAEDSPLPEDILLQEAGSPRRKRRILRNVLLAMLLVLVLAFLAAWWQRNSIADRLIADTFREYDIPASYTIESISPRRQVITDVVLGDPEAPDLTVERIEMRVSPRFGFPRVDALILDRPRLYGTLINGELSFGSLDPMIFAGEEGPFEFPDLALVVRDGRGLLEGDHGPVGFKLAGSGHLRGGFSGIAAATAPDLRLPGCQAKAATLYGRVSINAERPRFRGPVRFGVLECEEADLTIEGGAMALDLKAERNLADFEGGGRLRLGATQIGQARLAALEGEGDFTWRDGDLTARYETRGRDLASGFIRMASLEFAGDLRTGNDLARLEVDAEIDGSNVRMGPDFDATLVSAARSSEGTLLAPLLAKLRRALAAESRNSQFEASLRARHDPERTSIVVPEARLRGASGETLFALTRGQFGFAGEGQPIFSGGFATGGANMPRASGRIEHGADGALDLRLAMQEYASGKSRLAIPQMRARRAADGSWTLDGRATASGVLPGGFAQNLRLPIAGRVGANGDIALWDGCTEMRFDRLTLSSLNFGRQALTLCPPRGSSILRYDGAGLRVAAGATSLRLAGMLGETPIRIASGPVGFAWPGALSARQLDITLGPAGTATRFAVSNLSAKLGGSEIAGGFAGADVLIDAVPLDILGASGDWRLADGRLVLSDASFTLRDRQQGRAARFKPLVAQGADLSLFDNLIRADFTLRHPQTDREVTRVAMTHSLATSTGHADLAIDALRFDQELTPRDLTERAYGVVSLVEGTVTGFGRIAWDAQGTTSTGEFSSASLDFAAAFGPVKGASGTIRFTDLLRLTTAPNQRLKVVAVNPGIEVFDGEVVFSLTQGELLRLQSAVWPFLGGTLSMRPIDFRIGVEEERRYVFVIEGLEAAQFIERMELKNLAASGIFDGEVPIIFDAAGVGRLEGGRLVSRPPGGHVSYVGELTYEDLSPLGNLAFQTLRDLAYDEMTIGMNGQLTGELVTQVRFEGVRQGATAKTNFLTRRIAKLPIELRVNIRAPFYQLIRTMRSLYDPATTRDPRDVGLLGSDGRVINRQTDQQAVDALDEAREEAREAAEDGETNGFDDIQPPESEALP